MTGQRTDALVVNNAGMSSDVIIGGTAKSMWYEIQIDAAQGLEPIDYWTGENFTELQRQDIFISGPLADPDNDGIPNLMEFLFGTDPFSKNTDLPYEFSVEWSNNQATLVLTFLINKDYPEEKLTLGVTSNLSAWTNHTLNSSELTVTTSSVDDESNRVRIEYSPANYPAFIRLQGSE